MSSLQSPGARRRAERRERVIDAAMMLALDGGYDAVHMRDVAERADVSLGTIYRYFNGKDELLVAGLLEWMRVVRRRLQKEPVLGSTPAERLAYVFTEASRSSDQSPMLMRALVTAMADTDPTTAGYKIEIGTEIMELVQWALGDAPGVDVHGVCRVIGHVWFSAIANWVSGVGEKGSVGRELANAAHLLVPDRTSASARRPVFSSMR